MSALFVFLPVEMPAYSLDQLKDEIAPLFGSEPALSITTPSHPFTGETYLHFGWGSAWGFSAFVESGPEVVEDAERIQKKNRGVFAQGLPSNRIRLSFGLDQSKDFTNHFIWVWEHFSAIPGAVVYDLTQEKLW